MVKKTITYTDYNGDTRTEDFYFHISKAELIKYNSRYPDGLSAYINKIVAEKNENAISNLFYELIEASVGERSEDGKRFIKNDQIRDNFVQSEAYSVFLTELADDQENASEFLKKIMPSA